MTSQINPSNIDATYPVAGQPNNTQGFRDNFTATQTNFNYAATEITDLQNKAVLKAALTGTTLDNNMNDALIYAAKIQDFSATAVNLTTTSGPVTVDYTTGHYQRLSPSTGSVSLSFTKWPPSGSYGYLKLQIVVTNTAYTVTLPAAVSLGTLGIQGLVGSTISFVTTGTFEFGFGTSDGGTTITVFDLNRPLTTFANVVTITANTVSTSDTTGALTVAGGVGVVGNLNLGGNLTTYTSTGNVAFEALDTGIVQFRTPALIAANTAGALNIVGSSDGSYQPVLNTGSMLHITGNDNTAARTTIDTFGSGATTYPILIQRRARGTAATPTAVQSGDVLSRIVSTGYGNVGYVVAAGNIATTSIDFLATENYSSANAGSSINIYTSPTGAVTKTLSANITANVSTFPSVSATGNIVSTGNIFSGGNGTVGYNAGSGGTISQTGNKSGTVILNKPSGEITMQNTNLAADTTVQFTLTNSTISARDLLLLNIVGGAATGAAYNLDANCTSGSAVISVRNITGGTLGEAIVLRYAVIRGSIT